MQIVATLTEWSEMLGVTKACELTGVDPYRYGDASMAGGEWSVSLQTLFDAGITDLKIVEVLSSPVKDRYKMVDNSAM